LVTPDPVADQVVTVGGSPLEQLGETGLGVSFDPCGPGEGPAGLPGCNVSFAANLPNPVGDAQRFVLRVRRLEEPLAQAFNIAWSTNLTVAFGGDVSPSLKESLLRCVDKTTDGSPRDEIGVSAVVDGVTMVDSVTSVVALPVGNFKQDNRLGMDAVLTRFSWPWRFRDDVTLTLIEDDEFEDETGSTSIAPLGPGFGPDALEQKLFVRWFSRGESTSNRYW